MTSSVSGRSICSRRSKAEGSINSTASGIVPQLAQRDLIVSQVHLVHLQVHIMRRRARPDIIIDKTDRPYRKGAQHA